MQLVNIFTVRSITIGEKGNYVTETNYDEAFKAA